jgi:hypothetical protein
MRSKEQDEYESTHCRGYLIRAEPCPKCGYRTIETGRGRNKGWSGIECCGCGNLIENCNCSPRCKWCGTKKKVPTGLCEKCCRF